MHTLVVAAAYVVAYVALDWVSYIHPLGPFAITPWNPPPGLSLALLLVFGLRLAPAVPIAGLAAELVVRGWPAHPVPVVIATLVIAAGYTATAAFLHARARVDPALATVRDAVSFIGVVAIATMVIAVAYVLVHAASGQIAWGNFAVSALQLWVGDAIGILVTTPVLVHLLGPGRRAGMRRAGREIAAQAVAVALALFVVFGIDAASAAKYFYVLFLPVIWVSMRHGAPGAAVVLLAIQLGTIVAVQSGAYASATVLEFQLFMSALAVTGLVLGAVVSERSLAQDAVAAREAQLTSVVQTAPDGILVLDERGRVLRANEAAGVMFGAAAPALVGRAVAELIPGLALHASPAARVEQAARRVDGTLFPAEIAIGRSAGGAEPLCIAILRDVSDRKEMESQLRERESELARSLRLAAAAETASALAHELNQPLSAIGNYVRACALLMENPDANRERLVSTIRAVVGEVGRAGEVMRRLREFFRSGASRLERVAVAELVRGGTAPLAQRLARHRIALDTEIELGLPDLLVDRLQIEAVMHNLLANAIEAIASGAGAGGRIAVRATLVGTTVRITVSDTGPGLSAELAHRMFKPFTTTKAEGMGLGLAISRSIIENHGGRLVAEPAAAGAAFSFTLPIETAAEAAA
ncbi:MAG: MASE1 domain-containing protein [Burkholderiales bacterium]|nr:MASE1 domain-containing protein [Burkholderiales bacterium]